MSKPITKKQMTKSSREDVKVINEVTSSELTFENESLIACIDRLLATTAKMNQFGTEEQKKTLAVRIEKLYTAYQNATKPAPMPEEVEDAVQKVQAWLNSRRYHEDGGLWGVPGFFDDKSAETILTVLIQTQRGLARLKKELESSQEGRVILSNGLENAFKRAEKAEANQCDPDNCSKSCCNIGKNQWCNRHEAAMLLNSVEDQLQEKHKFEIENKRLRAALEWWFGTVIICNAGHVTHRLMRTRHEGWICVEGIAGETFFGYLKRGARTYKCAIDAILGAFDKYEESKSQEIA